MPDQDGLALNYIGYVDLNRNNLFEVLNVSKNQVLKLGDIGEFDEFGTMPISVITDGERLLAYYGGWTRCETVPFNIAIGMAESFDNGNSFTKIGAGPVLSYNLDEPFLIGVPKVRKFHDKYHLFYTAGKRWIIDEKLEAVYKIRMASSNDGINWDRLGKDIIEDVLGPNEAQASADVIFKNGLEMIQKLELMYPLKVGILRCYAIHMFSI